MVTDNIKRLENEIKRLERQHEKIAARHHRAFKEEWPNESSVQQELEANALLILTRQEERRQLTRKVSNDGPDSPAPPTKGRSYFTWVLRRRK